MASPRNQTEGIKILNISFKDLRPVVVQGHMRVTKACDKGDRLWVPFALEEIIYFMFSFLRSGNETKL